MRRHSGSEFLIPLALRSKGLSSYVTAPLLMACARPVVFLCYFMLVMATDALPIRLRSPTFCLTSIRKSVIFLIDDAKNRMWL
jgi:hypothetical protein